jgi:hypothetical protein
MALAGCDDPWKPLHPVSVAPAAAIRASGPLRVHPSNPRYFADDRGRPVYLTGSHTWLSLQDRGKTAPPPAFDYEGYLEFLDSHQHNFMRMWVWEEAWGLTKTGQRFHAPMPYAVSEPEGGTAAGNRVGFDLSRFNPVFFDRLRQRVLAARNRGIYVSIMLFQGWSVEKKVLPRDPWVGHPFNLNNNINGINGDPDGDGDGSEVHTLLIPAVVELQEAYVRQVIDTVNDLDNVLYEISNESPTSPANTRWQYHLITYIQRYQRQKPKQHPVLMTWTYPPSEDNRQLFASPADAISPGWGGSWGSRGEDYREDPPAGDGAKVIILDTDHLWGIGGSYTWVWKSFLRGLNPIFMDPFEDERYRDHPSRPDWDLARKNLGYARRYALRLDLARMSPHNETASTRYCLADPGHAYLVFLPFAERRRFKWFLRSGLDRWLGGITRLTGWHKTTVVDLSATSGTFEVEWFNPRTGAVIKAMPVNGGGSVSLTAPFPGNAVLFLHRG